MSHVIKNGKIRKTLKNPSCSEDAVKVTVRESSTGGVWSKECVTEVGLSQTKKTEGVMDEYNGEST